MDSEDWTIWFTEDPAHPSVHCSSYLLSMPPGQDHVPCPSQNSILLDRRLNCSNTFLLALPPSPADTQPSDLTSDCVGRQTRAVDREIQGNQGLTEFISCPYNAATNNSQKQAFATRSRSKGMSGVWRRHPQMTPPKIGSSRYKACHAVDLSCYNYGTSGRWRCISSSFARPFSCTCQSSYSFSDDMFHCQLTAF